MKMTTQKKKMMAMMMMIRVHEVEWLEVQEILTLHS